MTTTINASKSGSTTSGSLNFQIGTNSMTTGQNGMVYSSAGSAYIDFSSEL